MPRPYSTQNKEVTASGVFHATKRDTIAVQKTKAHYRRVIECERMLKNARRTLEKSMELLSDDENTTMTQFIARDQRSR